MFGTRANLNNVKVGDTVAICGSGATRFEPITLATVTRITDTQIVTGPYAKYYKRDGRRVGFAESWSVDYAYEITPEVQGLLDRQEKLNAIATKIGAINNTFNHIRRCSEDIVLDLDKLSVALHALGDALPDENGNG